MICHICNKDFSSVVYPYHVERCQAEPKTPEDMKLPELKKYAELNGIDLAGATKKEDVLAAILKAGEGNGTEPQGSAADQA